MKRSAAAALALTAAVSLTACGSSTSSAPSTTSAPTTSASSTPLTGGQTITAPKAKVTIMVPESWIQIDASKLDDSATAADLAERLNTTSSQLRQMVAQLDAMAIDPDGAFHSNVNIVLTPSSELPSDATIRASFSQFNAAVGTIVKEGTPLGEAVVATYKLPTLGGNGKGLFVKTPTGVVNVTFTAKTAEDVAQFYAEMVPTLALVK